jgi:hypothetical protein
MRLLLVAADSPPACIDPMPTEAAATAAAAAAAPATAADDVEWEELAHGSRAYWRNVATREVTWVEPQGPAHAVSMRDEGLWSAKRAVQGLLHEGLESEVARVKSRARKIIFRCYTIVGALAGGIATQILTLIDTQIKNDDGILAWPPVVKGGIVVFGVLAGGIAGAVLAKMHFVGATPCAAWCSKGTVGNFVAALEGRDYVPLPRTRGWGTTA